MNKLKKYSSIALIGVILGLLLSIGNYAESLTTIYPINGGTGVSAYRKGDLLYSNLTISNSSPNGTLSTLASGSTGQVLTIVAGIPAWQTLTTTSAFRGLAVNTTGGTFVKVTSISFDPGGFNLSNTASNGFLFIDYANGPASRSIAQTITGQWAFNATPISLTTLGNVGIAKTPITRLDVNGTASASNFVSQGAVQFANNGATVSYSRFGTVATVHSNFISAANDLLISGDLDVFATSSLMGFASISTALFTNPLTNNVGIGALASTSRLTIKTVLPVSPGTDFFNIASATGYTVFKVKGNGNVGIGTESPAATLDIRARPNQPTAQNILSIRNNVGTAILTFNANPSLNVNTVAGLTANSTFSLTGVTSANGTSITIDNSGDTVVTSGLANRRVLIGSGNSNNLIAPTTGGGNYAAFEIGLPFRQIGTSNGTTRSLYIRPNQGTGNTLQAYDYRDIEVASHQFRLHGKNVAGGIPTTLQSVHFDPIIYSSSAANTLTNVYGLHISGAPVASSSVTITNSAAIRIGNGDVTLAGGAVTNNFGLLVANPTGGTSNIAASISGRFFTNALVGGSAGDFDVCISPTTGELTNSGSASCLVSSLRFKNDIKPLKDGLSKILQLKPISFTYKTDTAKTPHIGLIAEDMLKVEPRLVFYEKDGITPRGIAYEELTALLTQSIQELNIKVEDQEKRIHDLEQGTPLERRVHYEYLGLLGLLGILPALKRKQ